MASESGDAVGVVGVVPGGADAAARNDGGAGLREVISGGGGHLVQGRRVTHTVKISNRSDKFHKPIRFSVISYCHGV